MSEVKISGVFAIVDGVEYIKKEEVQKYTQKAFKSGIESVLDKIDEGVCFECENQSEDCHKFCASNKWELEALVKWLKEQKNE